MNTQNSTIVRFKSLLILPFFFMLIGNGCKDKDPQYEFYENHNISACGIEDPLINIGWLKIITDEIVKNKTDIQNGFSIDLYEENETKNHVISIPYSPEKKSYDYAAYYCSGELTIYYSGPGETHGVPPAFPLHSDCTFVATLWSVTVE